MTQRTINMQQGHVTHGFVGEDFEAADDNKVELGYQPSMIHFWFVGTDGSDDPDDLISRATWYATNPTMLFIFEDNTGDVAAQVNTATIVSTSIDGFTVDGTELINAHNTDDPEGFIYEAYGGEPINAECPIEDEREPSAAVGGSNLDSDDLEDDPDDPGGYYPPGESV